MELRRFHNFMKMVAVARDKVEIPQALHLDEGFLVPPPQTPTAFLAHLAARWNGVFRRQKLKPIFY
jgi:hypothetical protein